MVLTGITLQPERRYLDLLAPVFERDAEFSGVASETMWFADDAGRLLDNGFHAEFAALARRLHKPVVAHGVGLSLGTMDPGDQQRQRTWLERIARDHDEFHFLWYTDHLGAAVLGGCNITLPTALPTALPMTSTMAGIVGERLTALQDVVPDVGFENSLFYFFLDSWLDEPAFVNEILRSPGKHLQLDLHNVYTMAMNVDADPHANLAGLDLSRVIEVHLSGGSRSDPAWLPEGWTMRLDSHDAAIPEPVWRLFEAYAPQCANLRGVCVERMEGTVGPEDVPVVAEDVRRAKEVVHGRA